MLLAKQPSPIKVEISSKAFSMTMNQEEEFFISIMEINSMVSSERENGQEKVVTDIQVETTILDISKEERNMAWVR